MKKLISFLTLLMVTVLTLHAQSISIKGRVTDVSGEPVIGASVLEKGSNTNGNVTGTDGAFTLSVRRGATLVVSCIGYVTQELPAESSMNIVLEEDNEFLDEVVVVAYGSEKRKNFTGSVSVLNVKSDQGVGLTVPTNAFDMLRGTVNGITMSQSGAAGAAASIQVRGQKSISGGSSPLVVVDGVIYKGSINDFDPSIIESMSVLKDATSLAAYGSQAANGVIMITTKRGREGEPVISFRTSVGLSTPNYSPDFRDGYEYIEFVNARNGRDLEDISWLTSIQRANYDAKKQTDWEKITQRTGVVQNYSLNVSGKARNYDYLIGGSYTDNQSYIIGNEYKRATANARVNTTIKKYFKLGLNLNFSQQNSQDPRVSYNYRYSPWSAPYMEDGVTPRNWINGTTADEENPLWNYYTAMNQSTNSNVTAGASLEILIPWVKGLSYKVTGNYSIRNSKSNSFTYEESFITVADENAGLSNYDKYLNKANGSIQNSKSTSYVLDNILTYTRDFGEHYVNATAVFTVDSQESESNSMTGTNFADIGNTNLGWYGLNNAALQSISGISYSLHNDVGILARVSYSYKDTYHFNASFRRDGSSVFGKDHKWGNFPAVGVAWSISNEDFFRNNIDWASNTKLKASWGKNGNQSLSPYQTLSRLSMGKTGRQAYYFNSQAHYGEIVSTLGNPNLGWETTTSFNVGLETDLLRSKRLHFEIDAYKSKTTDQIFSRTIPSMGAGISSQSATMGRVDNWGIEATLNANVLRSDKTNWTSTLMFTLNRNKLVDLYGDGKDEISGIYNSYFLQKSLGAIYTYKWIGVVQTDDKEYMAANGARPGDPMYEDVDPDGKIKASDQTIVGFRKEAFRLNWTNTFTYKNFSVYALFSGVFSGGMYGREVNRVAYAGDIQTKDKINVVDHPFWTPENKSNTYLGPSADVSKFYPVQSYGHVRLQDLNISYSFRGPKLRKAGINQLQFYLSGKNLFFIAPHWDFSDPEVRDSKSYQLNRTYTLGFNLSF